MKTIALLLTYCVAVSASPSGETASAANATSSVINGTTLNATSSGHGIKPQYDTWYCFPPKGAVTPFWRVSRKYGPYDCIEYPLKTGWAMLPSYRDGGFQNVHWKYTDNENDPECLNNWIYHAADGHTIKTRVPGRTTTYGQNRRWCGLPVYNDGGVEGYQWKYCDCFPVYSDTP